MRLTPIRHGLGAAVAMGAVVVSGCGQKQGLRPHMLDTEYEAALERNFKAGMKPAEVEQTLDSLGISGEHRRWYTGVGYAGVGDQLLARVFEPGGQWLDRDDATIEWVDTWFVFDGGEGQRSGRAELMRWYTKRGNQRYFEGEPINVPTDVELEQPMRRWPFPPSLPARPPSGGVGGTN